MITLEGRAIEEKIKSAFAQNPYLKWINFKDIEVRNYSTTHKILGLNKIIVLLTIDQYKKSKNIFPLMNDLLKILFFNISVYKASIEIYSYGIAKRKYELVIEPTSSEKLYFLKNINKFSVSSTVKGCSHVLNVDISTLNMDELYKNLAIIGYDKGIELYYPASHVESCIRASKLNELIAGS
jgi:hypothetical protein